eukprot:Seg6835.1 transcript_id=Seg6835.1/GoldUCD/mRNA.D3Y31 product="Tetratricopeptide repeat protein 29" protein_id=Seg6835.1/GoldUCD/D3Y31
MLQDGYHRAFCELFALLERHKEILKIDSHDASGVKLKHLEEDHVKLDALTKNLIAIETSRRRGRTDQVYQSQLTLAEYFSAKEDTWLRDYFYHKCLETSQQIGGDGRRREAEAHYNLGISAEKKLDFDGALACMEISCNLSKGRDWEDADGVKVHHKGCESLQRMYTAIAEQIEEADPDQAIEYLQKAFEIAKNAGNQMQEGKAGFRLGKAHEDYGDSDTAIKYFADYLEICNVLRDDTGKAQACHALADAYHSQGDFNNAIEYLTMYLDIAKRLGQSEAQGFACSGLGAIYNSMGHYAHASEYLNEAFGHCKDVNKLEVVEETRAECGVVSANDLFEQLGKYVRLNEKPAVKKIMSWRDARTEIKIEMAQPANDAIRKQESDSASDNYDAGSESI